MATELNVKLNNTLDGTSLKAIQDKNGNDIVEMYFPKSGGALSENIICRNVNTDKLYISGGTGTGVYSGGNISLYGGDNETVYTDNKGYMGIRLATHNKKIGRGTALELYSSGDLTWNGYDLAGSAIVAKSIGENGYIKYASGLIIQWGWITSASSGGKITFPISFASPYHYVNAIQIENTTQITSSPGPQVMYVNAPPPTEVGASLIFASLKTAIYFNFLEKTTIYSLTLSPQT